MKVILIAESSDYLRNALKNAFSGDYEVHVCADGCTALEQLHSLQPDGLIINMSLTYMDGLSVLQQASYRPAVIMALCGTITSYIVHSLQQVGVSFIMPVPCLVMAVHSRFQELMQANPLQTIPAAQQSRVAEHLDALGVPSHLNGYNMLCIAISLYLQDPLQVLSKETYPAVAEILGGKHEVHAIEHAIRSAIQFAWQHRDKSDWKDYFSKSKQPSNKQFIAAIAKKLH